MNNDNIDDMKPDNDNDEPVASENNRKYDDPVMQKAYEKALETVRKEMETNDASNDVKRKPERVTFKETLKANRVFLITFTSILILSLIHI